jgi:hypothetical protein
VCTTSSERAAQVLTRVKAKRLVRRYRAERAKGLKHRSAGARRINARPTTERERVVPLLREKYSGRIAVRFGPALARSASEDGNTAGR